MQPIAERPQQRRILANFVEKVGAHFSER